MNDLPPPGADPQDPNNPTSPAPAAEPTGGFPPPGEHFAPPTEPGQAPTTEQSAIAPPTIQQPAYPPPPQSSIQPSTQSSTQAPGPPPPPPPPPSAPGYAVPGAPGAPLPPPGAAYSQQTQAPAGKGNGAKVAIILVLVALLIGGAVAAVLLLNKDNNSKKDTAQVGLNGKAPGDSYLVAFDSGERGCTTDNMGYPQVSGSLTNKTADTRAFRFDILIEDSKGKQLTSFPVTIDPIRPGKKGPFSATGSDTVNGEFVCRIGEVQFNGK
jgi:hypothetical protein